jgi:uncharacterized protein YjbJ (UPF0337 family)
MSYIAQTKPEERMNWDEIQGKWKQVKGRVRSTWARLSDEDLDVIRGRRDVLLGKLRETYGWAKGEAGRQILAFERRLGAAVREVAADAVQQIRKARRKAKTRGRKAVTRSIDSTSRRVDRVRRRAKAKAKSTR